MRLTVAVLLLICASALSPESEGGAANILLVEDARPHASLVLPPEADDDERRAARELQTHLQKITGVELPIATGASPEGLLPIRIGLDLAPYAEGVIREQGDDPAAFLLSVTPDSVVLAGRSPAGTLNAAFELLEQLGCRWYMPGELGTVIPRRKNASLSEQHIVRFPSFRHRHLQAVSRTLPWYRRQRLGGDYFPGAHGIPLQPGADFAAEPELFALIDGQRVERQLCVSNREVLKRAIAATLDHFEKNPESPWIGMGPNDGSGFCECDGCRLLDAGEWDPYAAEISMTDRYIWFFNQILKGIGHRFPNKKIAFYAYASYKLPPRKGRPDPRIVPAFAPITLCRIHGMSNPICPDRSFYKILMRDWGERVPEVFERGYYFNLADPSFPFSKVHAIRDETVYAYRAGIKGWRVECMPSWAVHTPTLYVAARLMWDVDTDVDALLDEFYRTFFGPAADPMGIYLESIDLAYREADCHTGSSHCLPHIFDAEWLKRSEALLERASRVSDGVFAERVHIFRLSFERLKVFLEMLEARNALNFAEAHAHLEHLQDLTDTMLAFELHEGAPLLWPRTASYLQRFWSPCVEQGYERTVLKGERVAGAPEVWDVLIDPTDIGEDLSWYRDGGIGGNWQRMHTSTASWSDQGLHYYKGWAWYRTRVRVPASWKGRPIYLFFGGVDEKARVWLNGRLIGDSSGRSFQPFEFDVTQAVRPGEENTIAVRITNEELNEIGTGGITAPVLFWSPRAEADQTR